MQVVRRMTEINLQLQPDRSPPMDIRAIVASFSALDGSAQVSDGKDNGRCININFTPADPMLLWRVIRERLGADRGLASAAIVVCEGQHGWDDYLLLHHYERTLTLDEL